MVTGKELQEISKRRLRSAKYLLMHVDWEGSAYMMGLSLECALKSATCKALHLATYPEHTSNKDIDNYFMTHKFDCLLLVSGLGDLFTKSGPGDAYFNWSEFTKNYLGNWVEMRYNTGNWDKAKVESLYRNLTDQNYGIITLLRKKKRW